MEPLRQAFNHRDRLTEMERYLTEGSYYTSGRIRHAAGHRGVSPGARRSIPWTPTANNNLAILLEDPGTVP